MIFYTKGNRKIELVARPGYYLEGGVRPKKVTEEQVGPLQVFITNNRKKE